MKKYWCNLLVAASVIRRLVLVVFLTPLDLGSNWRGGRRQDWRAQEVLPGAQIVLLHRAVRVGLVTSALHCVVTGVGMKKNPKKGKIPLHMDSCGSVSRMGFKLMVEGLVVKNLPELAAKYE